MLCIKEKTRGLEVTARNLNHFESERLESGFVRSFVSSTDFALLDFWVFLGANEALTGFDAAAQTPALLLLARAFAFPADGVKGGKGAGVSSAPTFRGNV